MGVTIIEYNHPGQFAPLTLSDTYSHQYPKGLLQRPDEPSWSAVFGWRKGEGYPYGIDVVPSQASATEAEAFAALAAELRELRTAIDEALAWIGSQS